MKLKGVATPKPSETKAYLSNSTDKPTYKATNNLALAMHEEPLDPHLAEGTDAE